MKVQRARYQRGSVVLDRRRNVWCFRWTDAAGTRRGVKIGTLAKYPTKAKAQKEADKLKPLAEERKPRRHNEPTLQDAVDAYLASDWLPEASADGYKGILNNHLLPKYGELALTQVKPLQVDAWLKSLGLSSKTQANIKGVLHVVFEYAIASELLEMGRNPIDLVRTKGATLRLEEQKVITIEQARQFMDCLTEPARTIVLVAMSTGFRRSELAGLKWSDFDFVKGEVRAQRVVIHGVRRDWVKTRKSASAVPVGPLLRAVLDSWRAVTEFNADSDWVWASPWRAGEMPYDLGSMQFEKLNPAAKKIGFETMGWHGFRHSRRSWLDANNTPLGVQKDLMRHSNISTTMNVYGRALPKEMREASEQIEKAVIQ